MKKISILALHLGYGGIEKAVVSLANTLSERYEVEIACCYKMYEKECFNVVCIGSNYFHQLLLRVHGNAFRRYHIVRGL